MNPAARRWPFIMHQGWKWWVWLIMACAPLIGLMSLAEAFSPRFFSIGQSILFLAREHALKALPAEQQDSSPPSAEASDNVKVDQTWPAV